MLRSALRVLQPAIQSVADFFVDDACHLCSRRHADLDRIVRLHPYQRALAGPARVGLVPGVSIINHPICARCASTLDTTGAPEELGWWLPQGGVLLRSGWMIAADPGGRGGAAAPGAVPVIAPFRTTRGLLRVIHLVKFSRLESLLQGASCAVAVCAHDEVAALARPALVPVPMDARSVRRRGFNQSQRIAAQLQTAWGVPLVADALLKPVPTRPQSLTGPLDRVANVRGAFVAGPGDVRGCNVVLVDDLVTTGATAAVTAALLAACGAASVTVVCIGMAL